MQMVTLFAVTALLFAGLGIYATISFVVNEQTHDIGIRLELAAGRQQIMVMVLCQGLGLAFSGVALGLVGALIASQLLRGLVYSVGSTDPLTFVGVTLVLMARVGPVGIQLPQHRAKFEPARTESGRLFRTPGP
jgi:ABC-type antimicrobial peptide transport system permease subunit